MIYKSLHSVPKRSHASFTDPEALWLAAVAYFTWCDKNPLISEKPAKDGVFQEIHQRPYTHQGFVAHAGISRSGWNKYRQNPDFAEVVELIENVMYEQKFAGAACGLMNATVISRDLGLADKQDVAHSSPDGTMTPRGNQFVFKGVSGDSE